MASDADVPNRGERVWGGDWQARLRSSLHSLGCETVQDFLVRYPAEPYLKLVKRLGDHVAALQLVRMQFDEARQSGRVRDAAKDCLCRELVGNLKRGWGMGVRADFHMAGAYANWVTELERCQPDTRPLADAVWRVLNEMCPPWGWLPDSPDDPFLASAFARGWPQSA
jgi:hypothetical protein